MIYTVYIMAKRAIEIRWDSRRGWWNLSQLFQEFVL